MVTFSHHDAEISDFSTVRESRNTVVFQAADVRTQADENLGGYGQDSPEHRATWQARSAAQCIWQNHKVKGGLELGEA